MLKRLSKLWNRFETWVHSWFPGFKTRATAALGTLGMAAVTMQEFVTGLPATKWISQEVLSATAAIMFALSFWFSNMGKRVQKKSK